MSNNPNHISGDGDDHYLPIGDDTHKARHPWEGSDCYFGTPEGIRARKHTGYANVCQVCIYAYVCHATIRIRSTPYQKGLKMRVLDFLRVQRLVRPALQAWSKRVIEEGSNPYFPGQN